jgi:hypothetical protein
MILDEAPRVYSCDEEYRGEDAKYGIYYNYLDYTRIIYRLVNMSINRQQSVIEMTILLPLGSGVRKEDALFGRRLCCPY